jgi:NCS1 family nucleobase:cation symporter-1
VAIATLVLATVIGWGLVTNASAGWLSWQGYLLGPLALGGRTGACASANVGVLVSLVVGFVVTLVASRRRVRDQESLAPTSGAAV